jgi:release factor glutamine methyltransferase
LTTKEDLFKGGADRLRGHVPTPDLDSRLLLQRVTGCSDRDFFAHPDEPVLERHRKRFLNLIEARRGGAPLAYITGNKEFWSLDIEVSPSTLIPRPETELLVERALHRSPDHGLIADIGTGSGNIAAAVASSLPRVSVTATDVSRRALKVAERNFQRLGLKNIRPLHGSLFHPLKNNLPGIRFDLILSNPPYIPEHEWLNLPPVIRAHEPKRALVPGPTGLEIISRLIKGAPDFLKPGGCLILEMGFGQRDSVLSLLTGPWSSVSVHPDLAGLPRVVEARVT